MGDKVGGDAGRVAVSALLVFRLPRPGQPGVPGGEHRLAVESAREISLSAGPVMADPETT